MKKNEMISVTEFANKEGVSKEDVIQKIRDAIYSGQIINNEWFIDKSTIAIKNESSIRRFIEESEMKSILNYKNSFSYIWFSFSGKITVKQFWLKGTLIPWFLFISITMLVLKSLQNISDENAIIIQIAQVSSWIVMMWISLATTIKRLRDRNMSGWWYLLNFIPYIGPFIVLIICSIKGNENNHTS